jgi:RimJ/RimL family protein N-acetyltransferase
MPSKGHADISAEHLDLKWMSPSFLEASLDGRLDEAEAEIGASLPVWWPDEDVRRRLVMRLEQMRSQPRSAEWLLRGMVRRADHKLVGVINFHGTPDERNRAELGYTVFVEYRRLGYASEAAIAMMRWARAERSVETFVVSISPQNEPSLLLAAGLGFEQVGSQIDEIDGEEWVFELRPGALKAR